MNRILPKEIETMRGEELSNFINVLAYQTFNPHAVKKLVAANKAFHSHREEEAAKLTADAYGIENYTLCYHAAIAKH